MTTHDHDTGYKLLFSHPEMVRDLLLGFVPGEWVQQLDFATLERVNASYVSEEGKTRHDDMVWKVKLADEWLYVYVLLEFQSAPDRWMALRMLVYVGLLYQDLVKRGELSPSGKLPPVLPLALYNGLDRWTASTELAELAMAAPVGLEAFQPQQRYLLIDENTLDPDRLASLNNLAAALFRLEHSRTPDDLRHVIASLIAWLKDEEQKPLRKSLTAWILRLLRRKLKQSTIPDVTDLLEVDGMLAERIESWADGWMKEGMQQGIQQGIQQGMQKGMQQGEAFALQRLITKRFGSIPSVIAAQIAAASQAQIEAWFDLAIDAPTLEAVFGPTQH